MTIPIKPYIHPLVERFKPDSYVLVLCSRWQQEPRVTASSSKKKTTLERKVLCGLVEPGGIIHPLRVS
jgi:hypothetical protein